MVLRIVVVLVVALAAASPADAAPAPITGPGRIALPGAVTTAIRALPGGGALVAGPAQGGIFVRRLRSDGTVDPTFARDGVARLKLPESSNVSQLLVAPDGAIIVVAAGASTFRFFLVRLLADGTRDRGFGESGVASTAVRLGYERGHPAALAPDGGIVLGGSTGEYGRTLRPAFAKLTPSGRPDGGFATGGLLELPAGPRQDFGGKGVVVSRGGRIVVATARGLVGLTSAGTPDPGFNNGASFDLSGTREILARPDGSFDVLTIGVRSTRIVRFTTARARDPAFGAHGAITLAAPSYARALRLLLGADGSTTLLEDIEAGDPPTGSGAGSIDVHRITADGHLQPRGVVHAKFGGGGAALGVPFPLDQNAFRAADADERADGSLIVAGAVTVLRRSEGGSRGTSAGAIAAFTPSLAPDRSFGGPLDPSLTVAAPTRRAASVLAVGALPLILTASSAGLVRLTLRDARGHVLVRRVAPIFGRAATRLSLYIPPSRRGALRPGTRLVLRHDFRDIVGGRIGATSSIRLR